MRKNMAGSDSLERRAGRWSQRRRPAPFCTVNVDKIVSKAEHALPSN